MELIKSLFGETPVSISLAVAIIALIGAIVGVWHSNRKLGEVLNTKRAESKGEHDGLGKDHSSLEKDHGYLADQLTVGNAQLTEKLTGIANTATALREDSIRTQEQRKLLSSRELDIKTTVEQLTGLIDIVAELRAENKELKAEITKLKNEKQPRQTSKFDILRPKQQDEDLDLEP